MDEVKDDRVRQVETTKKRYGSDHYRKIGSVGGKNSPTKFDTEAARRAVQKRWENYRKHKDEERNKNG